MIGKLLVVGGVGLGAILAARAGWLDGLPGRRAREELGAAFRRIPLPHIMLHLPSTQDELDALDDALCECSLSSGAARGMTHAQLLELGPTIQACTASLLFPDIDWPPVHSDNPTIHQYWAILDQRFRRLVLTGELTQFCGLETTMVAPQVTGLRPQNVVSGTAPLVQVEGTFSPHTTVSLRRADGRYLSVQIHTQSPDMLELVVNADEPGSYDLIVANGPNPASSITYTGAFVVVQSQQE